MNNWRLLLLAVVVVVLPTGSFTESNLIDGRENCESSADARPARKTVERLLNGNLNRRQTNEERRLSSRNPERRYETTLGSMQTRSERYLERSERRLSPELSGSTGHRFTREQKRRQRVTDQTRENRKDQNHDEPRTLVQNERNSMQSRSRDTLDASYIIRNSRDGPVRFSDERESKSSMSRIPIRNSRSTEERMESPGRETTSQREREDLASSDSRRDTRFSASPRFESKIQLNNRAKQVQAAGNVRNEHDAERKHASFSERENRNFRERQRTIDLSARVSSNQRDSDRIAPNRKSESRDTARVTRMDVRNNEKNKRADERRSIDNTKRNTEERRTSSQQTRASSIEMSRNNEHLERIPLSMDGLSMHRQTRDLLSRDSERNSRDVRAAKIRDIRDESSEEHRAQRVNRISTMSTLRQTRDNTERMRGLKIKTAHVDARESLGERRQDNRVSRERTMSLVGADGIESRRMDSQRDIKKTSDERRQQRDNTERTTHREKRETRNKNERDESRRTVSLTRLELKSRNIDATSRPEKYDLRRQVLERSVNKAVHTTHSKSSEQKESRDISRASRSAEYLRDRDNTRAFERDERRQTRDQGLIERTHRNAATSQRVDTRRSSRVESTRLDRIVRSRDVIENEKLETQRDDRTTMTNRRSNERDAARLSQDIRNTREVGGAVSRLANERVTERRQETRDIDSRSFSVESRDRLEVKRERNLAEHRQDSRERALPERRRENRARDAAQNDRTMSKNLREVSNEIAPEEHVQIRVLTERKHHNERETSIVRRETRNKVDVRNEKMLAESRYEIRYGETARDIRVETRSPGEVRSERNLAKRKQETRGMERILDVRKQDVHEQVRDGTRREQVRSSDDKQMNVRFDSRRQRDAKETRINERSAQRTSDRNRLHSESKNQMSSVIERFGQTPSRLIRVVKREEPGFKNIDAEFYRNAMETYKSDDSVFNNWQMVLYTLQGIYVCGLIIQMLTESGHQTKKRINYWSSPKNLIKVD